MHSGRRFAKAKNRTKMQGPPEEAALQGEKAWLKAQNAQMTNQLAMLQQQHAHLMAQQPPQQHHQQPQAAPQAQPQPKAEAPAAVAHNPAWTEQINPEGGHVYYWNATTGESTYTKPADYNPGAKNPAAAPGEGGNKGKGPPGANLFIVRKVANTTRPSHNTLLHPLLG